MSSRRTMILIAAVLVGALSAFLVFNYVSGADDRAQGNAAQVKVLLVKKNVPRGMTGHDALAGGYIGEDRIQTKFRPATAVVDRAQLDNTNVAIAELPAGQVIVQNMFADAESAAATYAEAVPKECGPANPATGKLEPCVAIAISLDQVQAVGGVIAPGDFVNILVIPESSRCDNVNPTGQDPNASGGTSSGSSGKGATGDVATPGTPTAGGIVLCSRARVMYQAVKVLFVDRSRTGEVQTAANTTGASAASTGNTGLITLAVPPQAASMIASVDQTTLYLTLLPPSYAPEPLPALDPFLAVLPGEDANQLTPYGPNGIQKK